MDFVLFPRDLLENTTKCSDLKIMRRSRDGTKTYATCGPVKMSGTSSVVANGDIEVTFTFGYDGSKSIKGIQETLQMHGVGTPEIFAFPDDVCYNNSFYTILINAMACRLAILKILVPHVSEGYTLKTIKNATCSIIEKLSVDTQARQHVYDLVSEHPYTRFNNYYDEIDIKPILEFAQKTPRISADIKKFIQLQEEYEGLAPGF